MNKSVNVVGTDALGKKIAKLVEQMDVPKLVLALAKAGEEVVDAARPLVPVRTGELRDDVDVKVGVDKGDVEAQIGVELFYGLFLEKGTEQMVERPFLEPALDAATGRAREVLLEELRKLVKV